MIWKAKSDEMEFFGKKFECKACGAKFKTEDELMEHGRMHMAGAEDHSSHEHFSCAACGESFHSEAELKQHGQQYHRM
jgi:predicted RNA-binding Zn-ribbon protein involved in translation (DUF1610 family)